MPESFDVLILGAGPAGSTAATFLARAGLSVVLVDRASFPRRKLCGDFLNPKCGEIFSRLGISETLRAQPHNIVEGLTLSDHRQNLLQLDLASCGVKLPVAISRSLLDHVLLEEARNSGSETILGSTPSRIKRQNDRWQLVFAETGRVIQAGVVIGADGRNSWTAHQAGLGGSHGVCNRVAFQLLVEAGSGLPNHIQLHLFPGGYGGTVKINPTQVNVCFVVTRELARRHGQDARELLSHTLWQNPYCRHWYSHVIDTEEMKSIHPVTPAQNEPSGGNVYLVGDALARTEPFTGQGICFALQTGELASRHIQNIFAKRSNPPSMDCEYRRLMNGLYTQSAKVNALVGPLLRTPKMAQFAIQCLRICPFLLGFLVKSVLHSK